MNLKGVLHILSVSLSLALVPQQQSPKPRGSPSYSKVIGWKGYFSQSHYTDFHDCNKKNHAVSHGAAVTSNSVRSSGVSNHTPNNQQELWDKSCSPYSHKTLTDFSGSFAKIRSAGFSSVFFLLTEQVGIKRASIRFMRQRKKRTIIIFKVMTFI